MNVALVIIEVLVIWYTVTYLLTKGIILIALKLFDVNWYDNFWFVYLFIFIISVLFGGSSYRKN